MTLAAVHGYVDHSTDCCNVYWAALGTAILKVRVWLQRTGLGRWLKQRVDRLFLRPRVSRLALAKS